MYRSPATLSLRRKSAFTLVEVLVAIVVLSLLVVLTSTILQGVLDVWRNGQIRVNNYAKARVSLDLLTQDLKGLVFDQGLGGFGTGGVLPVDPSLSLPQLMFYSLRPGLQTAATQSDRPISLISYQVAAGTAADNYYDRGLERAEQGYTYNSTAPYSAQLTPATLFPAPGTEPAQGWTAWPVSFPGPVTPPPATLYQVIGPGVLWVGYRFMTANGTLQTNFSWNTKNLQDPTNTTSINVCLIVIDQAALYLLDNGSSSHNTAAFINQLNSAVPPDALPVEYLQARLALKTTYTGYPAVLKKSVEVYERTIAIGQY